MTPKLHDIFTCIYILNNEDKSSVFDNSENLYYTNVIITEYIDGINLKEYIKSNKLTEKDLTEIRELLKKLHSIGIFHGSISDESIMYDKNYIKNKTQNKFKFINFKYAKTCEILSSNKLQNNLASINKLASYDSKENIKVYIATFNLLKDKKIDIKL